MIAPTVGWVVLLLPLALDPVASTEKGEPITLNGRVIELTAALRSSGLSFDEEPTAEQVVLQVRDGTLIPLHSDEASRALFLDERLRDRPVEIKARREPSHPYVRVITFRIEEDGRLRTPEYFCEVCTIGVRYPQICPRCQGPMGLRMRPDDR